MADRLILCSECGTKNRVSGDRAGRPTCGNCGKALAVPGYSRAGTSQLSRPILWFALGVLSVISILYYSDTKFIQRSGVLEFFNTNKPLTQKILSDDEVWGNQSANKKQPDTQAPDLSKYGKPANKIPDKLTLDPPKMIPVNVSTGIIKRAKNAVAPLKIITAEGYNYFVKLVDMNNQTVMTMYIVGGESFETKAPLGTFRIRYVAGHIWYGEEKKRFFGEPPNTIGSKADELFEFSVQQSETETIYSGHTIELILQTNGNLRVTPISVEDF